MSGSMRRLKFWCQPVLPLTYDDSLSYYETLAKVVSKVNEVIKFTEGILEEAESYTDSQIAGLKTVLETEIAELRNDMEAFKVEVYAYVDAQNEEFKNDMLGMFDAYKNSIEEELADFENTVNQTIATLSSRVDTLREYVNANDADIRQSIVNYFNESKEYTDALVEQLEQEIQAIVLESVTKVVDPCDWETKHLQDALDNMYYNLRSWAFKARGYDMLGLTAAEYDAFSISAWNYDYLGKWWLWQKPELKKYVDDKCKSCMKALEHMRHLIDRRTLSHSAWTGSVDETRSILDCAIMEIRTDAITAYAYDALGLTSTEYESYDMTAYMYDWHALSILLAISDEKMAEYALQAQELARKVNAVLPVVENSISSVEFVDDGLSVSVVPFNDESYAVNDGLMSTQQSISYQIYNSVLAVNALVDTCKYNIEWDADAESLNFSDNNIAKLPENLSASLATMVMYMNQALAKLSELSEYYSYVSEYQDEIFALVGTRLVAE